MKTQWVKYICDPVDKTSLEVFKITNKVGDDIISGILKSKSGNFYKVVNGVPVLLTKKSQKISSVASFAYEWNEFDFDYGKGGWLSDIVRPLVGGTKFFKNKIIVDCGSGSGRQSLWMSQSGAKFVFSLELSDASRNITKKVADRSNGKIFVIQCDISNPPINNKNVRVDLVYCINVIQHTKNVKLAVSGISKLMNKKTDFIFNIYLTKGRKKLLKILDFVRMITKLIPHVLLKYLSFVATILSFILSKMPLLSNWFNRSLPINRGFKETWLDIYDILGSHEYQKFYSEIELMEILDYSKLVIRKRSRYAMVLNKI